MKRYTVTRNQAASLLWVSTRTIDRYVKSGRLSYKKIANKVILNEEELRVLQNEFSSLRQEISTELLWEKDEKSISVKPVSDLSTLDEKLDKFYLIFQEKDKQIDEKNKIIFMLQQRIGELEAKIQTMIALPDYNKEKQQAIEEKRVLEEKLAKMKSRIKEQETKTYVVLVFAVILVIVAVLERIFYISSLVLCFFWKNATKNIV